MESIAFSPSAPLTLGVEIEVQLLDAETFELVSVSPSVLSKVGADPQIKAELLQNMLEINTPICGSAHDVRRTLLEKIELVEKITDRMGVRLAMSGTHPRGKYLDSYLYPSGRYQDLIDRNQWIARRLMIFGLHVHVGMRNGDHCIQMNNALLNYLPVLLALSASSPYWQGEDTGLASCRVTAFEAIPTGGTPPVVANSWSDFQKIVSLMVRSGAITALKDIWWDIRPSPKFGTLEIRICDNLPTLEEVVSLVAFIHCLCAFLDDQLTAGQVFTPFDPWIMRENKWRASRHGHEMKVVINAAGDTKDFSTHVNSLLSEFKPYIERFHYEREMELMIETMARGQSYERQRRIASSEGLRAVAKSLADEFTLRHPKW
jgi:glutamate---cysteine ligase / carboxylate-amine ligase